MALTESEELELLELEEQEAKAKAPQQQEKQPWYQKVTDFESNIWKKIQPYLQTGLQSMQGPAYQTSPQALLQTAGQIPSKIGSYVGEKGAQQMAYAGMNPKFAAGLGLAATYLPDVAMAYALPTEGLGSMTGIPRQNMAMKSLGFTKRFLGSEQKLSAAKQASQDMLDQGVISSFASPTTMAQRASDLAEKSGSSIGNYLTKTIGEDKIFNPQIAIDELESLRPMTASGKLLKGGYYDPINAKIDKAVETIKAHGEEPLSWKEANDLKGTLQDRANWLSNKEATILDRVIAGKYRSVLDKSLENQALETGKGKEFLDFLKNKQLYQSALRAEDPLYNRISSEMGNRGVSLTDFIIASPEIAMGNYGKAMAILGGKKLMQQYGAQIGAVGLNKLSKNPIIPQAAFGTSLGLMDQDQQQ